MARCRVDGALVFGQGHDRAGIMIEPRADYKFEFPRAVQEFRNSVW
jgi:hypothetical protein